jgi:hypothetical protein
MSLRPIARACAFALATVACACAHTRVTPFDPNARLSQRTLAADIRFFGAEKPRCPYDEIGRVSAESRPFVSWDRVVKAAREAAFDLGGDAVIDVKDAARLSGAGVTQSGIVLEERTSLTGIVIRFRHLDCME